MITEQQLKDKCTPELIKQMCELAEGFHISERYIYPLVKSTCINYNGWCAETTGNFIDTVFSFALFPLLIHRALEGWNKKFIGSFIHINITHRRIESYGFDSDKSKFYEIYNYQPQLLTQSECAMLHCLFDIFEEEEK